VSYDPTNTATLRISRKLVSKAIERGLHFELQYSPCVLESGSRRNTIAMAHTLYAVSRGTMTIIVTSAASHPEHLRSPYDIANLYPCLQAIYVFRFTIFIFTDDIYQNQPR
jgi:ribonuclease P/MRP protein subunit RPP1